MLPWGTHWIIGTTDTPWEFGLDHPAASRADIDYLLGHANAILRDPLTVEDITGVYVGLRPLVAEGSADTAAVSREHVVRRSAPGLVSIAGGKYTTYRIMARDAVDVASRDLPFAIPPSHTEDLPLLGAVGSKEAGRRARLHPGAAGLSPLQVDHLAGRYGTHGAPGPGPRRGGPGARRAPRRRGHVPRRRGPLRRAARGGAARGRRPHAPHAHRLRGAGPRPARRRGRGAADGAGPRVGRGDA